MQGLAGWEGRVLVGTSVGQDLSPEGHWETQQINSRPRGCLLQTASQNLGQGEANITLWADGG